MTTYEDRLNRQYKDCEARNDWQGMAAVHAERMRLRNHTEEVDDGWRGAAGLLFGAVFFLVLAALSIALLFWH